VWGGSFLRPTGEGSVEGTMPPAQNFFDFRSKNVDCILSAIFAVQLPIDYKQPTSIAHNIHRVMKVNLSQTGNCHLNNVMR